MLLGRTFGPTAYDLKFHLVGVDARVHPSFWLGGLIFARNNTGFVAILIGVGVLFLSIFVHEMGHALCGKYYGDRVPSITLHAMGGHYSPGKTQRYGKQIWMLLCGPLAGFILGGIAVGCWYLMLAGLIPFRVNLAVALLDAIWVNITWGFMNLMPVYPLDGGQIFLEVMRWKYPLKDDAFTYQVSLIVAAVASAAGLVGALVYGGSFLFIALFFASLGYLNYKLRKFDILTGGAMRYEEEDAPREPWEQNADWWKNGGKDDGDSWKNR